MGLVNVKSKKNKIRYTGDFPNGKWNKYECNENGKLIYWENHKGEWVKTELDTNGNRIYYEDSVGYWEKSEYAEHGNLIYYENSFGKLIGNRK